MKCERCGQLSLDDKSYTFKEQNVCKMCFDSLNSKLYSWDNEKLAIQMNLEEDKPVIVPLFDNLQQANLDEEDYPELENAFLELKKKWESEKWGYYGQVYDMKIVEVELEDRETVKDSEFDDLWIYKALSVDPEFYSRPFDKNPETNYFVNWFAADCYKGVIYSKDFAYTECEVCGRTICQQNPSNGWMSQVHIDDNGNCTCNKCYEESALVNGINDEFNGSNIPGQFFNDSEISEAGWEKVEDSILAGSGYSGHRDPKDAIGIIQKWIDAGKKVLVNYESMAIGGLGGYVSIYIKEA